MYAPIPPTLAGFVDVLPIVIGVLASLCGLGLLLMGLIAVADRAWRRGGIGVGVGLLLTLAGLWLVGVL